MCFLSKELLRINQTQFEENLSWNKVHIFKMRKISKSWEVDFATMLPSPLIKAFYMGDDTPGTAQGYYWFSAQVSFLVVFEEL